MRGIRGSYLGWLLVGVLTSLGGSGCCCCSCLHPTEEKPTPPPGNSSNFDGESHLDPVRIHGGII
jgi:hypothetical protein